MGRLERLAPLTGVLFTVLVVVGLLVAGETPDSDAPVAEIFDHYDDEGPVFVSIIALLLAGVVLVFFAAALRRHFASVGPTWLAPVVFGGGVILAAGLGIFASSQIALVDAADNDQRAVLQALNILDNNNFGVTAVGLVVVYLASAWHILASRSLAVWLGWIALLLGILGILGPLGFIAFIAFPIWVLLASIVLFRAQPATPTSL